MEQQLPKRKANRLVDFDYSQNGAYFVTNCSKEKQCIFGEVVLHNDENIGAGVVAENVEAAACRPYDFTDCRGYEKSSVYDHRDGSP